MRNYTEKNSFVRRLEQNFTGYLLKELKHRPLTKISVSDLCKNVSYPRATFYKYYYDMEDLFSDFLIFVLDKLNLQCENSIHAVFIRLVQYQESNTTYLSIYQSNKNCQMFLQCFHKVLRTYLMNTDIIKYSPIEQQCNNTEFTVDYYIKNIELLLQYRKILDNRQFDKNAELLL